MILTINSIVYLMLIGFHSIKLHFVLKGSDFIFFISIEFHPRIHPSMIEPMDIDSYNNASVSV